MELRLANRLVQCLANRLVQWAALATVEALLLPASKALCELELTRPAAIDHLEEVHLASTATEMLLPEGPATERHRTHKLIIFLFSMRLCPTGSLHLYPSGPCPFLCLSGTPAVGYTCPRLWMCKLACRARIRRSYCT